MNRLARTVLHMLFFIMFCCFQRERMGGIQEFQSMVLNLENEGKMQGKEMRRNVLACHDLAKQLSYYLYFFFFLFLFFYLGLTTQKKVRESVTSQCHIT